MSYFSGMGLSSPFFTNENRVSSMRLIGIHIDQNKIHPFVRKSLKDEWYPFYGGISYPPHKEDIESWDEDCILDLYDISSISKIKVSISCIVGKNGSGKSTLLDIMYAIVNNFSYTHLRENVNRYGVRLYVAKGVYASLYYELDRKIYEVRCEDKQANLYEDGKLVDLERDHPRRVLHESFFYTVALNYSLYSFNKLDYLCSQDKQINGKWIDGLFHKNDAYYTPMSLNPFRTNGNIDINKETGLALQRLSALALYFDSKGKNFIPNYKAVKLKYRLRPNYEKTLIDKFAAWEEPGNLSLLYDELKRAYNSSGINRRALGAELYNDVISYLAYKALKIGLTYANFKREMTGDRIDQYLEKIADDNSHITYKIRQCQEFAKHSIYERDAKFHEIRLNDIYGNRPIETYEKAFELLPPTFYDIDVLFEKEKDTPDATCKYGDSITFKSMSSGERQLMYSLSSILYHIQNLESVEDDVFRVSYRHINLVLDEVELYSHPEYQRTFVADLLDRLSWLEINYPMKSINILLVTHSPFILSDIPKSNILYLKEGKAVTDTDSFVNTLGANVNDILHQSFFLENGFMGEHIQRKIQSLIRFLKSDDAESKTNEWNIKKATQFINTLGDELVASQLRLLLAKKQMTNKNSYRSWLEQELERLKGNEP